MSVETKLRAARTRLILDRPFIGALVMHLALSESADCTSVATDARTLRYNAAFVERLTLAETQFVLAHEAMHCALGHFARRAHRVKRRWDVACDHAVNLLLLEDGLTPPAGVLADPAYRGLSAEEIYPLIPIDTRERTLDAHAFDGYEPMPGNGVPIGTDSAGRVDASRERGAEQAGFTSDADAWSDAAPHARRNAGSTEKAPPLRPPDAEALAQAWRMRLATAAQQARHGGRLGTSWQRLIETLIEPMLPWRTLLARYLVATARDDYSFQRLSRRGGDALLPSLYDAGIEVFAILDTSGSVGEAELAAFASEVDALKGQVRARVTLHACDDALAPEGPWVFQPWQSLALPAGMAGGGGTDFRPVFEWVAAEGLRPDVLIYFTDAEGEFPAAPPPYPVVWLVKGRATVPWGERIQLN